MVSHAVYDWLGPWNLNIQHLPELTRSTIFLLIVDKLQTLDVLPHGTTDFSSRRGEMLDLSMCCPTRAPNFLRKGRELIVPQSSQTFVQLTKPTAVSTTSQTDANITNIICPPLQCLTTVSSANKMPSTSSSIPTVSTSSSSQARPSTSPVIPTVQSESQLPLPIPNTTPLPLTILLPQLKHADFLINRNSAISSLTRV
ncbi:hypothetical protein TNCV_3986601 [Trichonephila clavipes]|nr:hypothetical protein TNCV_3986601 [Trichonephila clavipes]